MSSPIRKNICRQIQVNQNNVIGEDSWESLLLLVVNQWISANNAWIEMNRLPLYFEGENNGWGWICSLHRWICVGNGLLVLSLYIGEARFVGDWVFGEQVVVLPISITKKNNTRNLLLNLSVVSSLSTDFFFLIADQHWQIDFQKYSINFKM